MTSQRHPAATEKHKRATVYFDATIHQALRLKAAATDRSISEMVNEAVIVALAEDAEDLAAFDQRGETGAKLGSDSHFAGRIGDDRWRNASLTPVSGGAKNLLFRLPLRNLPARPHYADPRHRPPDRVVMRAVATPQDHGAHRSTRARRCVVARYGRTRPGRIPHLVGLCFRFTIYSAGPVPRPA